MNSSYFACNVMCVMYHFRSLELRETKITPSRLNLPNWFPGSLILLSAAKHTIKHARAGNAPLTLAFRIREKALFVSPSIDRVHLAVFLSTSTL